MLKAKLVVKQGQKVMGLQKEDRQTAQRKRDTSSFFPDWDGDSSAPFTGFAHNQTIKKEGP